MIIDSLDNAPRYYGIHPLFEQAFEFLMTKAENMDNGVYEIQGRDLYATICNSDLRDRRDAMLEAHDRYIDIQYVMNDSQGNSEVEGYGWASREGLKSENTEKSDSSRDLIFYNDDYENCIRLTKGNFVVFFNTDAHAPLINLSADQCGGDDAVDRVRKIIVKVKI